MDEVVARHPGNENPWYVLLTVAGDHSSGFDEDTHARNRRFWHGWVAEGMEPEHIDSAVELIGVDPREFEPLQPEDRDAIDRALAERANGAQPEIGARIDLSATDFSDEINFRGFVFPGDLRFVDAIIRSTAEFTDCVFQGYANFLRCEFKDYASFNRTHFKRGADFPEVKFHEVAEFEKSRHYEDSDFNNAVFHRTARFHETRFDGVVRFQEAQLAWALFVDANFCNHAYFRRAKFNGHAAFKKAGFARYADFSSISVTEDFIAEGAEFFGYAYFRGATFNGDANFQSTRFLERARFNDATFNKTTKFAHARFEQEPPMFFGASVHEDTSWYHVHWPKPSGDIEKAHEHLRAYERLKLLMDSQKKTHDEQMFHRMELRCREIEDGYPRNLPSRLYGWISDYGWSLARPSLALLFVVLAGWVLLGPILCWSDGEIGACTFKALFTSTSNTFSFLGLWRLVPDAFNAAIMESPLALTIRFLQAVLGPVFLFFLLLALRNKYRMR